MSGENTITVFCNCGKKLKAPAAAAGKKARCPACQAIVTLTVPGAARAASTSSSKLAPPPVPARKTPEPDFNDFSGLDDLEALERNATAVADSPRCGNCRSEMDDNAVLCMNCGYDSRTGKALAKASASPGPAKSASASFLSSTSAKKPVDMMAPTGSLMLGIVLSAAFAVAASSLWILVSWLTGFAIGYIGLLIGGAAGMGMRTGQKGFSSTGGMIAAVVTLGAIFFAKLMVLEILLTKMGLAGSIFDLDSARLGLYLFSPMGLIIIAISMGAAFRTANGSTS